MSSEKTDDSRQWKKPIESGGVYKGVVIFGILIILAGVSVSLAAVFIIYSDSPTTEVQKRSDMTMAAHVQKRNELNITAELEKIQVPIESEKDPDKRSNSHIQFTPEEKTHIKMGHRKRHYNVEKLVQKHNEQVKVHGVKGAWVKVESAHSVGGKKLDMFVHLLLKQEVTSLQHVSPITALEDPCLPPFTLGVNLSLPASPYSVDFSSITTINLDYARQVIEGGVSAWNALGTQPVFGARQEWSGVPDDSSTPDGQNQITFGSISPSTVLAFTRVYGYFTGAILGIVEWDIVFGDTSNTLCDAVANPTCHHFPKITIHELGHALGAGDVYTTGCDSKTVMYGIAPAGVYFPTLPQPLDVDMFGFLYPEIALTVVNNGTADPGIDNGGMGVYHAPLLIFNALMLALL